MLCSVWLLAVVESLLDRPFPDARDDEERNLGGAEWRLTNRWWQGHDLHTHIHTQCEGDVCVCVGDVASTVKLWLLSVVITPPWQGHALSYQGIISLYRPKGIGLRGPSWTMVVFDLIRVCCAIHVILMSTLLWHLQYILPYIHCRKLHDAYCTDSA